MSGRKVMVKTENFHILGNSSKTRSGIALRLVYSCRAHKTVPKRGSFSLLWVGNNSFIGDTKNLKYKFAKSPIFAEDF